MKVDRHEGRPRAVADFMQDVEPTVEAADGDAADGPAQERIRPPKRPLDDDSSAVSRVTLSPDLLPLLLRGVPTRDLPVVARVCTFWGLAVPIALDERRAIELERVVPLTADTNAPVTQEEALLRRTEAAAAGKWFRASMVDHCVHIFPEEQLSEQAFRSAAVRGGGVRDRLQPVGRKLGCIGGRGSAPGHFLDPSGVAVSDTHLIVADAGNHRLQFFTFEGWHVRCVGVQRTADAPPSPGGSAWPAAWFPAAAGGGGGGGGGGSVCEAGAHEGSASKLMRRPTWAAAARRTSATGSVQRSSASGTSVRSVAAREKQLPKAASWEESS